MATQANLSRPQRVLGVLISLVLIASLVWASLFSGLLSELALIGRAF